MNQLIISFTFILSFGGISSGYAAKKCPQYSLKSDWNCQFNWTGPDCKIIDYGNGFKVSTCSRSYNLRLNKARNYQQANRRCKSICRSEKGSSCYNIRVKKERARRLTARCGALKK